MTAAAASASASASIATSIAQGRRLLVCVGPGGVGKTSFAAALALAAAREGRRVFVLTIDPARRLADALGIALGDPESPIEVPGGGTVHAAMLETRASWDRVIDAIAPDPDARARILANRVYRAFSRTLARSHAYVAMERLHHVLLERDATGAFRWDLVVLDTPPTRSALDVLDAPSSLSRFLDARVTSALVGRAGSTILRPGAIAIRRALGVMMGGGLADELATFLETFAPMRAGFARRASEVRAILVDPGTAFVLVAAPLAAHLDDAAFLRADLERRGVPLALTVLNRAFHEHPAHAGGQGASGAAQSAEGARDLLASAPGGSEAEARQAIDAAHASRRRALADDARAEAAIADFLCEPHDRAPAIMLPLLASEPCSPAELLHVLNRARSVPDR